MKRSTYIAAALAGLALQGCSGSTAPDTKGQQSILTSLSKTAFERVRNGRVEPVDPYKVFTRELIDSSEVPVILAGLESRDSYGTLFPAELNRGIDTWRTADNITISFDRGVVVASRGLGDDLMAADAREAVVGITRAGGEGLRIHDYLDGEDQSLRRSLYCTYRSEGLEKVKIFSLLYTLNHVVESCETPGHTVKNDYWVERESGTFRQSRQWLGPDIGYVFLQQLTR